MLLPPYSDELLSSWIIRNSIAHGTDPMGWTYGFWGEWRAWTRDIDRYLPEEKILQLSKFSKISPNDILSMTLVPEIEKLLLKVPSPFGAWSWVIPQGKRNRTSSIGLQFCPKCLQEAPVYFPKYWRLSFFTHCKKHKTPLLQYCEVCNNPFSPHLIDFRYPYVYQCVRCGSDLRKTCYAEGAPDTKPLEKLIFNLLSDKINIPKLYSRWHIRDHHDFFSFFRDLLSLPRIISRRSKDTYISWQKCLFGRTIHLAPEKIPKHTFDMLSVEQRRTLLYISWKIFEKTPESLKESLRKAGITQADIRDRRYPASKTLQQIILVLDAPITHLKHRSKSSSSLHLEPLGEEEIEKEMNCIRRYI